MLGGRAGLEPASCMVRTEPRLVSVIKHVEFDGKKAEFGWSDFKSEFEFVPYGSVEPGDRIRTGRFPLTKRLFWH